MKLDLNKLNRLGKEEFNLDFEIDLDNFKNTDIIRLNDLHFVGVSNIDAADDLVLNGTLSGTMILPCAITLEEVLHPFSIEIEENLGNFDEIIKNNKNSLDIIPLMCENIVLEIPIRVVKEGVNIEKLSGPGWELSDS